MHLLQRLLEVLAASPGERSYKHVIIVPQVFDSECASSQPTSTSTRRSQRPSKPTAHPGHMSVRNGTNSERCRDVNRQARNEFSKKAR